jgi:hypothetical protein
MNIGGSYLVTMTLQNTGLSEWTCQGSAPVPPPEVAQFQLRYWWVKGTPSSGTQPVAGVGRTALCGVAPGETITVSLLINDVPYGGTGTYTLKFDIYDRFHDSWFSYLIRDPN